MRKAVLGFAASSILSLLGSTTFAQSGDGSIKIGVLNDQSSSFSVSGGKSSVEAARLAIADFGGQVLGKPIELVAADHQNKTDVGLSIARKWLDSENVDVILDMANSAIALGVNTLIGERKKVGLFVSALTDRPTEENCNGHVTAWAFDPYSVARSAAKAQIAKGRNTFFIISFDYEAGKAQEAAFKGAVEEFGGKVIGAVRAPQGTTDFSTYLLQAQSSGAKVLMLTLVGSELINALKQINEFGLTGSDITVGVTILHQAEARSIGLETLRGIEVASPWVWTVDQDSKAFAEKMKKATGQTPGFIQAGVYSATMNYLQAVKQAGTDDSSKVLEAMRRMKISDFFSRNATLWPNGRLIHDFYLLQARQPGETSDPDDLFKVLSIIDARDAFRPLEQSKCPLAKS
jgi:branched-chain amino acid transport system substrate-binding protein